MRHLQVTAQDRSGNGRADTVLLRFYEDPDNLKLEAFAVDLSADGYIELSFAGDINNDGEHNLDDQYLLTVFADAFLKLKWFNTGNSWERHLKIEARSRDGEDFPNIVNLEFRENYGNPDSPFTTSSASAEDSDNDGKLDSLTCGDVNNDGVADTADKLLLRRIAEAYLAIRWF